MNVATGVLTLTKTASGTWTSPHVSTSFGSDLRAYVEVSEDGLTSAIIGQLVGEGVLQGKLVVLNNKEDLLFRKLPAVALEASGNFLVVWEEENEAGTDDIIAARFNLQLGSLGLPFQINDTEVGQQAEPWASGDDSGNTVVVWTSYSEDASIAGDIYGKILDSSGQPVGPELLISSDNLGNQFLPQVQMDGDGGFVVAWTEEPAQEPEALLSNLEAESAKAAASGKKGGVYYRVFGRNGWARGPERRVESGNGRQGVLSRLEVHRHGGFRIRWREIDEAGNAHGEHEQEHDQEGNALGNP